MSILIVIFTALLLLLSAFVVLVILMQKPSANAGMGAALGGGAAEQAFGGNAANVLTKTTVFAIIGFFVLSFGLYLANLSQANIGGKSNKDDSSLNSIVSNIEEEAPEATAVTTPVATEPNATSTVSEEEAVSLDNALDNAPESTESTTEPAPEQPTE